MPKSLYLAVVLSAASFCTPLTVSAQETAGGMLESLASTPASVTYGPYLRAELGSTFPDLANGYWLPPGPSDPLINFNLDGDNAAFASLALGFDWQNGFRGEFALSRTGAIGFSGPCSSASDGSPCDRPPADRAHADITDGSVRSTVFMANVFFSPFEAQGSNSRFQPFVVGGIGFSENKVESWTRFNLDAGNPPGTGADTRVFGENTETDFAWSLGVGTSWQVTRPGEWPVLIDMSWRYYDYGEAVGGETSDVGGGTPRQPLTFDLNSQVLSIGIRIPLQRL